VFFPETVHHVDCGILLPSVQEGYMKTNRLRMTDLLEITGIFLTIYLYPVGLGL
jgi:hypothetical protein